MARPLRIEYEGAWYHLMNRGAGRQRIFKTDAQRQYFLSLLADTSERFNAEWHAYCLMGNHYHLLIRTPEANLQRIMRHINGLYTQYYNRSEKRDGALFRGRYQAILVDEQTYWAQLSRYIHRNPLEARIVTHLDLYPWSSYPAYIGDVPSPDWLNCNYILKSLATSQVRQHYKSYVDEGNTTDILSFYKLKKRPTVLGSDLFKKTLTLANSHTDIPELKSIRNKPTHQQIAEAVCGHMDIPVETIMTSRYGRALKNHARGMAMYLCQSEADMKLSDIATYFGLKNYTSASSGIRQFERRLADDGELRDMVKLIKLDLTPCASCALVSSS